MQALTFLTFQPFHSSWAGDEVLLLLNTVWLAVVEITDLNYQPLEVRLSLNRIRLCQ